MSLPTPEEINEAIKRLALTNDGRLLYRHLQIVLMSVSQSTDSGALLKAEGRRTFARELKLLMDEELGKRATSDRYDGQHDPDGPAVERRPEPVKLGQPVSRRRVLDDDHPS